VKRRASTGELNVLTAQDRGELGDAGIRIGAVGDLLEAAEALPSAAENGSWSG
jgi:hypothetical protein